MRRDYNILWLDDKIKTDSSLRKSINKVEKYLRNVQAFYPHIEEVETIEEALQYCNSTPARKIDLFISDFNIDQKRSGFDFLKDARCNSYKQDMLLYSNNSVEEITRIVVQHLSETNDLTTFTRFSFESLNDPNDFFVAVKELIELNLEKWNELNALRGLYLSEVSQLEMDIKERLVNCVDMTSVETIYKNNLSNSRSYINKEKSCKDKLHDIFDNNNKLGIHNLTFGELNEIITDCSNVLHANWLEINEIRNSMAHIKEEEDASGRYIVSCRNSGKKYYEKDIIKYRRKLLEFIESINMVLNNLGL